ncbi:hypothetical protein [Clostridium tertium]|nr:hypothetical protein [Clostridium tertium]MDI9216010.1 hypothetical protein [Clostridium tertium]
MIKCPCIEGVVDVKNKVLVSGKCSCIKEEYKKYTGFYSCLHWKSMKGE